ncbi:MAG: putative toxin-antitoxin system toxin component, PIN family [Candidatus Latescibacteria bacterium 4484_107]|nr:MAG: putative toxin-antitoxin system toxin component, PIN family [Candidatus Latescibacteria bacterium 4484_107]
MIRVVLDTNIVISATLAKGLPSSVLTILLRLSQFQLCVSEPLLEEYRQVFMREKFEKIHQEGLRTIAKIEEQALNVIPKVKVERIKMDRSDNRVLECALTAGAHYLITGNRRHFNFGHFFSTRIVSPYEFLDIIISG